jgi:DNA-binding beta-propeller fold protein YncE
VKRRFFLFAIALFYVSRGQALTSEPMALIQTIEMPNVPTFPFTDHLAVDLKGHRLFATPEGRHSVQIFDIESGKFVYEIAGIGTPHDVVYRSDLDRIYVSDGDPGLVRIYDGHDYHQINTIKLLPDADSTGYDPVSKYLYVTNGGEGANLNYSLLSIVDTTSGERMGDIKVSTGVLEQMAIESSSSRIYINLEIDNKIAVLDRLKQTVLEMWPITKGKANSAIALDEAHHRLFVGCRNSDMSGVIVVLDTRTGREIEALPIGGLVDYMAFDPRSGRIYASCGTAYTYVYQERDLDHYDLVAKVETAVMGKTGLLVPELNRYFVSVPHIGSMHAKILVFKLQ